MLIELTDLALDLLYGLPQARQTLPCRLLFGLQFVERTGRVAQAVAQQLDLALAADDVLLRAGQVGLRSGQIGAARRQIGQQLLVVALRSFLLLFHFQALGVEPLDLVGAAENAGVLRARAARHGAAGVDHLPVERDELEAVAVFSGNGHGAVHILHHNGFAQQGGYDLAQAAVAADEFVSNGNEAVLILQPLLFELAPADGGNGQERGAAKAVILEESDGAFGVVFVFGHDVLQGGA